MKNINTDIGQNALIRDMLNQEGMREKCIEMMKNELLNKYNFPAKKSSDGYFHIYVSDDTKKSGRKQIKAKTIQELKEKVYQHEIQLKAETFKTFKDVFELVQSEKTMYVKDKEKLLSISNTISRNKSEYKRFFDDTPFELMNIVEITSKHIEDIVLQNIEKRELRPKGIASMKALLNQTFDYAYKHGLIYENPFLRADFAKFRLMASAPVPIEKRAYTDNDLKKFLDYLHDKQEKQKNYLPAYALELQILTGLRRGEIPPLQWSDVTDTYLHIHREQLTVKKCVNTPEHFEIVNHTKTYKDRKYPMCDDLKDLLQRLKSVHDKYYPNSIYLFPAKSDNGVITNNTVYNLYRRMIKDLGYKQEQGIILGTHSFRRNAITRTVNASNGNLVLTASMFGNSPQVIQTNYYTGININDALFVANQSKML